MAGAVRGVAATVVLIVVLSAVHSYGMLGPFPLTLLLPLMVLAQLLRVPRVNTLLSGGDLRRRLWLRMGVHYLCLLGPALYLTGWGPVAMLAFVATTSLYIEWAGSGAWRPAVCFTVAGTTLGQVAILTGLAPSYLSRPASTAVWAVGLFGLIKVTRELGHAVEKYERSEVELRESQRQANRSERWFRTLVQNVSDVIMVVDEDGRIRYVSPSVRRQLGYRPDDVLTRHFNTAIDTRDHVAAHELWDRLQSDPDRDHRAELRLVAADGTTTWHEIVARNMLADPDINGVVINHRDSHERRMQHEDLAYEASHDPLTGLANRAELQRILDEALHRPATGEPALAVLFIDLDGFKPVNDRYGHDAGDALLCAVARLLERSVLGADTVARVGGDEFVIVLHDVRREDDPECVAARILENLAAPIHLPSFGDVRVGASIGVAASDGGTDAAELLRNADQAMYEAKRNGRNRVTVAAPARK